MSFNLIISKFLYKFSKEIISSLFNLSETTGFLEMIEFLTL